MQWAKEARRAAGIHLRARAVAEPGGSGPRAPEPPRDPCPPTQCQWRGAGAGRWGLVPTALPGGPPSHCRHGADSGSRVTQLGGSRCRRAASVRASRLGSSARAASASPTAADAIERDKTRSQFVQTLSQTRIVGPGRIRIAPRTGNACLLTLASESRPDQRPHGPRLRRPSGLAHR